MAKGIDFSIETDYDMEDPGTLEEWDEAYADEYDADLYDEEGYEDIYDSAYEREVEAFWRE